MDENRSVDTENRTERSGLLEQAQQLLKKGGEFLYLPEEIWQAGISGLIPLEDMLLDVPISQWLIMLTVLDSEKSSEKWQDVGSHLGQIRTREDMRYDLFDMHMVNFWASGVIEGDSTESVERLLREFSEANMRYARKVYREFVFTEATGLLPGHIRAAAWVEKALSCGLEEHEKKMDCLTHAAQEWPPIGKTIKSYAVFLGKDMEKVAKKAQEATSEMSAIAIEVKKQIMSLIDGELYAEAYAVTEQLQQLTPDDPDLEPLKAELKTHFS
ncbi:MAG: hypothetical protein LUI02_00220 [Clostridiales bacterium]|nr:hypothetical protein [Clostridiales bacterium]